MNINEDLNEIKVNGNIFISDILNKEDKKNNNFIQGRLFMPDMSNTKEYEILFYKLDEKTVLVKPTKPYHCYVFEDLFNLGFRCEGFNLEKIIKIKCD